MAKKSSLLNLKIALIILIGLFFFGGLFYFFLLKKPFFSQNNEKVILPPPASYPKNTHGGEAPFLTAKSTMVMDVDSGAVLFEKDSQIATSPASLTKIMTAIVSLENYKKEEILEAFDIEMIDGQKMKLLPGEKITLENLLHGLLVASANDAALVLAKSFPNKEPGFIWAMNQKAKELGLEKTNFVNPVGYDDPNHYSTAYDLANLAIYAMKNPEIASIAGTEKITVYDVTGTIPHPMSNINTLVGKLPGVKGIKTGWTQEAGECLVTFVERDNRRVVTVVLGSQDRFGETTKLIEWVFNNFSWEDFIQ